MFGSSWLESNEWLPVSSSNVGEIRYDSLPRVLYVRFQGGREYSYSNVSPQTAQAMHDADSKGQFVHRVLKGKYPALLIRK